VLLLLPLFLFEIKLGIPGIKSCAGWLGATPADQVAWIYLFLQLVPAIFMTFLSAPAQRLARKFSPPNPTEQLSRPEFIYDQAVEEAESALDLVNREHARLIRRLPQMLDPLRPDEAGGNALSSKALHEASCTLTNEISEFLDRLMAHCQTHESLERMIRIRSCLDLLKQLYDTELNLASTLDQPFDAPLLKNLRGQLVEGLHTVLMVFADCADSDPEMRDMLETITSDRSDLMKQTRSQLLQSNLQMNTETQSRLFLATSLFERMIWLVHRYAELMERDS
jgi:phosphate:Na+ symporter